ncbi:hypothetical protein AAFF_G00393140 [Aldrovandia affinis]|uniref:Uncharacterized protein n=1 Tax=Aldrovandia affinis TaxID=143900 RepID=A0AAD7WKZ5_9TELE|nr:hypothetical protein AAFF_G00393140 [Aldrovandia affinis]
MSARTPARSRSALGAAYPSGPVHRHVVGGLGHLGAPRFGFSLLQPINGNVSSARPTARPSQKMLKTWTLLERRCDGSHARTVEAPTNGQRAIVILSLIRI